MKFSQLLLSSAIAGIFTSCCHAQLLQWNTFGNTGTETFEPSFFNDSGVASSNLTLGSGVNVTSNTHRFGGQSWFDSGDPSPTTLSSAIAANEYFQFVLSPSSGFRVTPTSFVFSFDHSSPGVNSLTLRSSHDGYATDLGTVSGLAASLTSGNTINIAGLNNLTADVTFRLYGYGATSASGNGGFDTSIDAVNVQLNGFVTPVPEPASLLALSASVLGVTCVIRRRPKA